MSFVGDLALALKVGLNLEARASDNLQALSGGRYATLELDEQFEATVLDDGSLVIVGNGGSVIRSTDQGQSFSVFNRADRISLSSVSGAGNGNLILAGQGGVRVAATTGAELGSK